MASPLRSLAILALFFLAGCGSVPGDDVTPHAITGLSGFEAIYEGAQARLVIRLGNPASILDADLKLVDAYPMELRYEGGTNPDHVVVWLSGDLRVVRTDNVCRREPCPSGYEEITWVNRGHWPPMGFAFNHLHDSGERSMTQWGVEQDLEIRREERGSATIIAFGDETARKHLSTVPYLGFQRSFDYVDADPIPDSMTTTRSGSTMALKGLEFSGELPAVPILRTLSRPPGSRVGGDWFPGSDAQVFSNTTTPDAALAGLSGSSSAFRARLDTECLTEFHLGRPYTNAVVEGVGPTAVSSELFGASTAAAGATSETTWTWTKEESPVTGVDWVPQDPGSRPLLFKASCVGSPFPEVRHGVASHVQHAAKFPWDGSKAPLTFAVNLGNSAMLIGDESPVLQVRFQTGFGDNDSSGFISNAIEAPQLGAWLSIGGEPNELARLEGAYGWPHSGG